MSPRSSVTVSVSCGRTSGPSGAFAVGGRAGQARAEANRRRSAARARSTARRRAGGCRRGERGSRRRRRRRAWQGVADDPGAVAVVGRAATAACSSHEGGRRPPGRRRTSERSAQASAFWTSGSASPISWPMRSQAVRPRPRARGRGGGRRTGIVAIVRADEAALPARRRVDELLELRPAVRLVRGCPGRRHGRASRR